MATGATIFGCAGPRLNVHERAFFTRADPWGFILFARNVQNPAQLQGLTAELRATVGRDAPVLIDQEGGRVQRLGPPQWRDWTPPLDFARSTGAAAPRAFHLRYRIIAEELRNVGIDVNCAPLADIATATTHAFLRDRCYGTDAAQVVARACAVAQGLLAGGVLPVLKHIPGHGRAGSDSHAELPLVTADAETLRATDFVPFRALADLPMAMTAHVVYGALDTGGAATLSPVLVDIMRRDIGFEGLLMTDDIGMGALRGSMAARSRTALKAGCDIILHCSGVLSEMEDVAAAAGTLGPRAARRADAALAARRDAEPVDIAGLEAELEALMNGEGDG